MSHALYLPNDCCRAGCYENTLPATTVPSADIVAALLGNFFFARNIDIRGDTSYAHKKVVWGLGDLAAGDGGGIRYWFDSASLAVDNVVLGGGGTVIRPTAIAVGAPGRYLQY